MINTILILAIIVIVLAFQNLGQFFSIKRLKNILKTLDKSDKNSHEVIEKQQIEINQRQKQKERFLSLIQKNTDLLKENDKIIELQKEKINILENYVQRLKKYIQKNEKNRKPKKTISRNRNSGKKRKL